MRSAAAPPGARSLIQPIALPACAPPLVHGAVRRRRRADDCCEDCPHRQRTAPLGSAAARRAVNSRGQLDSFPGDSAAAAHVGRTRRRPPRAGAGQQATPAHMSHTHQCCRVTYMIVYSSLESAAAHTNCTPISLHIYSWARPGGARLRPPPGHHTHTRPAPPLPSPAPPTETGEIL